MRIFFTKFKSLLGDQKSLSKKRIFTFGAFEEGSFICLKILRLLASKTFKSLFGGQKTLSRAFFKGSLLGFKNKFKRLLKGFCRWLSKTMSIAFFKDNTKSLFQESFSSSKPKKKTEVYKQIERTLKIDF